MRPLAQIGRADLSYDPELEPAKTRPRGRETGREDVDAGPLAALNELLDNLPLVCRLGSPDARESLASWLEVWPFVDEDGRTQMLGAALWEGQRRFLEALLSDGHVLSIKSRKVGLSTLVCAHAAD